MTAPVGAARRRLDPGRIGAHVVLIASSLAILLPLLWIVRTSIVSRRVAYHIPPEWGAPIQLDSWEAVLVDKGFLTFFANSLGIGLVSTALALLVGVPAAYSIARWRTGGSLVRVGVLATQILPAITLVIPIFIIARDLGLLDSQGLLAVMYLSFNLPFVVWILIGFFRGLPVEIEEAGLVDGASRLTVLTRIVVPIARPGLIAAGIFSFVLAWNEFLFAFILTGLESRTLPVALVGLITQQGTQIGPMAAATVLMSAPVIALTFLVKRYLVTGLTFGSVK